MVSMHWVPSWVLVSQCVDVLCIDGGLIEVNVSWHSYISSSLMSVSTIYRTVLYSLLKKLSYKVILCKRLIVA